MRQQIHRSLILAVCASILCWTLPVSAQKPAPASTNDYLFNDSHFGINAVLKLVCQKAFARKSGGNYDCRG